MALHLADLDDHTRHFMLDELAADAVRGCLYRSPYLTEVGRAEYGRALRAAIRGGTAEVDTAEATDPGLSRAERRAAERTTTLGSATNGR